MRIANPTNGFVRLESHPYVVLTDVWLTEGIYDGAWHTFPPLTKRHEHLGGATHCFISHIHPDHYDLAALHLLERKVTMLIPDVYPNHLIKQTLSKMGFADVRMLRPGARTEASPGLFVTVVPRMNAFGQEAAQYKQSRTVSMITDTGVVLEHQGVKAVLLADNYPYFPEGAGSALEEMRNCDLLGFSYNGAASDYPLCYTNLSDEEQRGIAGERERHRADATEAFIRLISLRLLMPYSSEFALAGPMAKKFADWCGNAWWADKVRAGSWYEERTDVQAIPLYEGDTLTLTPYDTNVERVQTARPTLSQVADALYSQAPKTLTLFRSRPSLMELDGLVRSAAHHMFDAMDRYGIKSDGMLGLDILDRAWPTIYLDLGCREISQHLREPYVTCCCEPSYLSALLRGQRHWNSARISFHLRWGRVPNVFDRGLYDALNFLQVPRRRR